MSGAGRTWLAQAHHDLAVAERLLAEGAAHDWASYAAQQAAEKALKAVLLALGQDVVRTHDLVTLSAALRQDGALTELLDTPDRLDDLAELTQMNVVARYPLAPDAGAPAERITRRQAAQACATARQVVDSAARYLDAAAEGE
ncbi:HEPN domain-containing protein [Roseospira navarrensis]|uniref:HEPN domain-containing protein n=1 Tax=Roseospira navarrensis TaxID=140058 RepID=A0A7X1ZG53_9PROT|nr:HEPN domain-containing protein [Roseospira navarrensis]MQX37399.1 HEPN domain-containing protein [Roseospira navarrensis]